jgi:hypothetical protein
MMSSRTILVLSAGALLVFAGGIALTVGAVVICSAGPYAASNGCGQAIFVTTLITSLCVLVGGIATFTTWILGLVRAATRQQWGWFVAILFLTPIATLAYTLRVRD